MDNFKLYISPNKRGIEGGIGRVIDAQRDYFASNLVSTPEEADVIAIHAGSLVKCRPDQTVIAHCHGLHWSKYKWNEGADAINKSVIYAMHIADAVTAPTEWVANAIRRGMSMPCTVIPHAVDKQWIPGTIHKDYVLWNKSRVDMVCSPTPVYDVAELLPNTHFKMTVGKAVHPNIEITGLTPYADIKPVQEAGVYLATAQETFGIGILEALACGVPVVGWNWGGQADILPKEWLAQEGDLASLAHLIQLAPLTSSKDQCIEIASRYTWENIMPMYEEVYSRNYRQNRRVSVIIRNYNTAHLLPDVINSILPQLDFTQDECIVVDDCSTDNSIEVASSYPDVKVVKTPQNLYLSGALNHAMKFAYGEYILHIDADNMLAPRTIEALLKPLEQDRNFDIAYGRIRWVKDDGVTPENWNTNWPPAKFSLDAQLSHRNQIPNTSMYRRRVYDRTGPYRNRCRNAEDADFWCRATSLGFTPRQTTTAETLIYRNRPNTLSATTQEWAWEHWYDWRGKLPTPADSCEPILISVIIPVGPGHELLLQDALDSLYVQTFKNWECIVVNDTGHDLPWLPNWVKVIRTNKIGPGMARNIALDKAIGGLWIPLDADDYLEIDAIERMVTAWRKNKGYIYSDYTKIEIDGKYTVVQCPDMACQLLKEQMPHIITGLYPVLPEVRFEDRLLEDWDFALNMVSKGYCGTRVPEPLVYYRKTSGTRRETWNDHYHEIYDKWGETTLPCNCRGKQLSNIATFPIEGPGMAVRLHYDGVEVKKYYIGQGSGATYAFGTAEGLDIKVVLSQDVNGFLGTGLFSLVS